MASSSFFSNDLQRRAEASGWLRSLNKSPQVVLCGPMTRLITAIKSLLVTDIAKAMHFEEWIFPRMVPEEVLSKTGWLKNHREEAWLLDPKQEFNYEPDELGLFPKTEQFPNNLLPYALDPIQCVSFYYALYGERLRPIDLPLKVYEHQGGWSFRHESKPAGLKRGIEFLRMEFVWLGSQEQAEKVRNDALKRTVETLRTQVGLDVGACEGDSCFEEASRADYHQDKIHSLENLPELFAQRTVDVVARLEENGSYDFELASASRHETLPRRFDIGLRDSAGGVSSELWSGCLGIGITRVAAAFLTRFGFDTEKWEEDRRVVSRFRELAGG